MPKFYDWDKTLSYQTGNQGEHCIVVGAKGVGKTFGLRVRCIKDFLKSGERFCEISRTKAERDMVKDGYFDKISQESIFPKHIFKVNGLVGYIAEEPPKEPDYIVNDAGEQELNPKAGEYAHKPKWEHLCYFVALTIYQTEKKRTFANIKRYIFDEAIIDSKDRFHHYLPSEFMILANLLDSISRQQPGGRQYRVYYLGNACDLTCPYFRYHGIAKVPEFGYRFYKNKTVLLHYVEPWDPEERKTQTLVGRMLDGLEESEMVFDNKFIDNTSDICKKNSRADYKYAIVYNSITFGVWMDYTTGLCWITERVPKGAKNIYTITKRDATVDYRALERTNDLLKLLNKFFYSGLLRYENPMTKELFLNVLDFLGVR